MNVNKLKRPQLNKVDLKESVENMLGGKAGFYLTMSIGQWDNYLENGYFKQGAVLIELDYNGNPINAYKYEIS